MKNVTFTSQLFLGLSSDWRRQECLPMEVEFSIYGSHRPATRTDPEEHPELEIHSIKVDGLDVACLVAAAGLSDEIAGECWNFSEQASEASRLDAADYYYDLHKDAQLESMA
jgi:hypothetical protein